MGIALNTVNLQEKEAKKYIINLESEFKIPVTDVLRFGVEKIVKDFL